MMTFWVKSFILLILDNVFIKDQLEGMFIATCHNYVCAKVYFREGLSMGCQRSWLQRLSAFRECSMRFFREGPN